MSDKEKEALYIVRRLVDSGFRAVFAGGCVRDRILGVEPKDYDIATDARPEVVQKMFDRTVAVGAKFGVIGVVLDHDKPIEVATFRADAEYTDGRRPSSVRFGAIEEDAIRRDFTIGGMFYDPDRRPPDRSGRRDARSARRNHPRDRKSLRPLRGRSPAHPARRPLRRAVQLSRSIRRPGLR